MDHFNRLWEGFLLDRLSPEEMEELLALINEEDPRVETSIKRLLESSGLPALGNHEQEQILLQRILDQQGKTKQKGAKVFLAPMLKVAAVVLLAMGMIVFLYYFQRTQRSSNKEA